MLRMITFASSFLNSLSAIHRLLGSCSHDGHHYVGLTNKLGSANLAHASQKSGSFEPWTERGAAPMIFLDLPCGIRVTLRHTRNSFRPGDARWSLDFESDA